MIFEMRLILEIYVVVNNLKMILLKYWDLYLNNFLFIIILRID